MDDRIAVRFEDVGLAAEVADRRRRKLGAAADIGQTIGGVLNSIGIGGTVKSATGAATGAAKTATGAASKATRAASQAAGGGGGQVNGSQAQQLLNYLLAP